MNAKESQHLFVELIPGRATAVECVDVPADKVVAIFHFRQEHLFWLQKLITDSKQLIADNYRSAHPRALMLPNIYVVLDERLPRVLIDRINLAGAIAIDRPSWNAELKALYPLLTSPIC